MKTMLALELELDFVSVSFARSLMQALEPDNQGPKCKTRITSRVQGRTLHIRVHDCPRVETMESTLQDIFRCVKAAEEALPVAELLTTGDRKRRKTKRFK